MKAKTVIWILKWDLLSHFFIAKDGTKFCAEFTTKVRDVQVLQEWHLGADTGGEHDQCVHRGDRHGSAYQHNAGNPSNPSRTFASHRKHETA